VEPITFAKKNVANRDSLGIKYTKVGSKDVLGIRNTNKGS
jgi:hypothetical protein